MTPREFLANDKLTQRFRKACEKAGIEPSARQASKWLMRKGAAWTVASKDKPAKKKRKKKYCG